MTRNTPDVGARGSRSSRERGFAASAVATGLLMSVALAPTRYFLPNFLCYWAPQALLLGVLLLFRARAAVVGGVAFALALFLLAVWAWTRSLAPGQGLAWLVYWTAFPGALLGAVAAVFVWRRAAGATAVCAGMGAAGLTAVGIAVNVWAVWMWAGRS